MHIMVDKRFFLFGVGKVRFLANQVSEVCIRDVSAKPDLSIPEVRREEVASLTKLYSYDFTHDRIGESLRPLCSQIMSLFNCQVQGQRQATRLFEAVIDA